MLKLFYITNNPEIAKIAQDAGVDRIFVDMEYIGKEERQPGMNTVKNHHTVSDVRAIRKAIDKAELLVRVNPLNDSSEKEINDVIDAGADVIMLPMWKSAEDVRRFYSIVNSRVKTILLLETDEAAKCIDDVLGLDNIGEIHIGLNDLHLSQGKHFLFELLTDGTVDALAQKFRENNITFGFGGFGRVFQGNLLAAERIVAEHYRLGSSMAILSRAFCNTENITNLDEIKSIFESGIKELKSFEQFLMKQDSEYFVENHKEVSLCIDKIIGR